MVGLVRVVAILMIVQAALAVIMGLVYVALGVVYLVIGPASLGMQRPNTRPIDPAETTMFVVLGIYYTAVGIGSLISCILTLISGIRALNFRGRTMAITALFSNIVPIFTCYCAPTSLGVMIFGLIVMFQRDVAAAFKMADEGRSTQEILDWFRPRGAQY